MCWSGSTSAAARCGCAAPSTRRASTRGPTSSAPPWRFPRARSTSPSAGCSATAATTAAGWWPRAPTAAGRSSPTRYRPAGGPASGLPPDRRWTRAAASTCPSATARRPAAPGTAATRCCVWGQLVEQQVCAAFGGAAAVASTLYVPCTDGVRQVRAGPGARLELGWQASGTVTGSPVVGGHTVYSLDPNGGTLYALDADSGTVRASAPVGTTSRFATPTLSGGLVLVGTMTGVVALSAQSS